MCDDNWFLTFARCARDTNRSHGSQFWNRGCVAPSNLICTSLVYAPEDDKNSFSKARSIRPSTSRVRAHSTCTDNGKVTRVCNHMVAVCKISYIVKGLYFVIWWHDKDGIACVYNRMPCHAKKATRARRNSPTVHGVKITPSDNSCIQDSKSLRRNVSIYVEE